MQTYLYTDYPADAEIVGAGAGAAGVDLFVADLELIGRGVGSEMLRRFVRDIVFAQSHVTHCLADPDNENVASIRAFEKAGFHVVEEFRDPRDGKTHALVRVDREPQAER